MSYLGNILRSLTTSFKGMAVVISHLPKKKVTRTYPDPEKKYIIPERARNRLYVNMDDCIGCYKCARACPVNCIIIETVKATPTEDLGITSNGKKKSLWLTKFDIDMAQCCFCSLCIWPCPTECIVMTEAYEYSEPERRNLLYHFATMDEDEAFEHVDNWKKWEVEANELRAKQAAERAAKVQAATEQNRATNPSSIRPPYLAQMPKPPSTPDESAEADA